MAPRNKKQRANERRRSDSPVNQNKHDLESQISNADAQRLIDRQSHVKKLRKAALKGDWKAAEAARSSDTNIAWVKITETEDTALHIAAATKRTAFVCNLVGLLSKKDLELKNNRGYTAFCFAAASGVVEIAKVMYEKNKTLPTIRTLTGKTPLEMAVLLGKRKMVEYLYPITFTPLNELTAEERMDILIATINSDMYDIGLKILRADRSVVTFSSRGGIEKALLALAQKPLSHNGTSQEWIWERLVRIVSYLPCFQIIFGSFQKRRQAGQLVKEFWKQILTLEDLKISELFYETSILSTAVRFGNVAFLTLLSHSYPELIWKFNKDNYSIFHLAVINRQEKIFSLIYQIGVIADMIMFHSDRFGNNILHLAATLPPPCVLNNVYGASLQMQREIMWYKVRNQVPFPFPMKEVEKVLRSSDIEMKNKNGITPRELFIKKHKDLQKAGEEWMKERSTYCMVVATLIATVAFAAAFTVPGGSKQETGDPIFLEKGMFRVFVISDAAAMFSSTASIVTFLSILTSRYKEDDFLLSLPVKLMVGLITLFVSIVCMVSTFSATFFLIYKGENQGTSPKFFAAFAGLPIVLYVLLNYRLWMSLAHSTFLPPMFKFRPGKHILF